jgi:fluoride exporter
MFWIIAQVGAGGAIGAVCRHLTQVGALRFLGPAFPAGTLIINVVGSFLMGLLFVWLVDRDALRFAPFLLIGVLGGFTTFSTFSLDAFRLYEAGSLGALAFYVLGSVVLSIGALIAGIVLARGLAA